MHARNTFLKTDKSHIFILCSSEIIFPEVKHRRNILMNQLPIILEPNIWKKINHFFGTESKFFMICLKENILPSRFLLFLNDFRYAWATVVALCSQGSSFFSWQFNAINRFAISLMDQTWGMRSCCGIIYIERHRTLSNYCTQVRRLKLTYPILWIWIIQKL